ncbi:MAG TPA: sulfatase-like hydrolase/transferase [Gammaproteobacteria bacterium]|nr:sulfatase-like hydrolase/transferase [Gammaproteobacteria bacterium]
MNRTLASRTLAYFIGLLLIGLKIWTNKYFGRITIDQALTTIVFNYQGSIAGDSVFLHRLLEWCVAWPLSLALVLSIVSIYFNKWLRYMHHIIIAAGIILVFAQYQVIAYIHQHLANQPDYFAQNYRDPAYVAIHANQPKNLVLIYVESLETSYSNTKLFNRDLLRNLNHLRETNTSFKHYQQIPGTEWSVAGIVATQCAIPLKLITLFSQNKFGEQAAHILPRAYCLGDILTANGYKNIYMNGSELSFGGVGKFFKDHHYQELYGRSEWQHSGIAKTADISGWGLHDDKLLEQAKIKLNQLEQSGERFNLTIFTIDTHGPEGHLNQLCKSKHVKNFAGIVECTADDVADFVEYVKRKGWLKNTNVVVIGDHLAMQNPVYDKLTSIKNRTIFNMIISDKPLHKNTDNIIHFDMLPTILSSLGFKFDGEKLGLGYSAFIGNHPLRTRKTLQEMKRKLPLPSKRYNELWVSK